MLDMEPYTAQGIEAREKDEAPLSSQMYELVGIVVHSGQASAGHYYSFIKDKRCGYLGLYVAASDALFLSLSLHSQPPVQPVVPLHHS